MIMDMEKNKKLVLKDGSVFEGYGFGKEVISEVVFNTSIIGYQEIISDPSYKFQIVLMTYPLIGNYGINDDDFESNKVQIEGLICSSYIDYPSNFRENKTLKELLNEYNVPLLFGIDTRKLTSIIRDKGSMIGIICDIDKDYNLCLNLLNNYKERHNHVKKVSSNKKYVSKVSNYIYNVGLIDLGSKKNIVRMLNDRKCNVYVFPYNVSYDDIINSNLDGIMISNGPGDPKDCKEVISLIKKIKGKIPLCGICLGHQVISLSYGLDTYKLKFGHRGSNHPVKNLENNKIEITSQNHSYAVKDFNNKDIKITHLNLIDNTIEGIKIDKDYIFSLQYHPESSAGPEDSKYFFDKFINNIKRFKEDHHA